MSSLSKKTAAIRNNKKVKSGKRRKRAMRKLGSTPTFPIHVASHTQAAPPAGSKRSSVAAHAPSPAQVARIPLKTVAAGQTKGTPVTEAKASRKPDPRSE